MSSLRRRARRRLARAAKVRKPGARFIALCEGAVALHTSRDRFDYGAALATVLQHADPPEAASMTPTAPLDAAIADTMRRRGFRETSPGVWTRAP